MLYHRIQLLIKDFPPQSTFTARVFLEAAVAEFSLQFLVWVWCLCEPLIHQEAARIAPAKLHRHPYFLLFEQAHSSLL